MGKKKVWHTYINTEGKKPPPDCVSYVKVVIKQSLNEDTLVICLSSLLFQIIKQNI